MSEPLVAKGDRITCTNGHVIGEAIEPVRLGDVGWYSKFSWTENAPSQVTPIVEARCLLCGASFVAPRGPTVWQMHFDDGTWR